MMKGTLMVVLLLIGGLCLSCIYLYRMKLSMWRVREENRRLRKMLQTSAELAQNDLQQLRQLKHDLRHYLILLEGTPAAANMTASLRDALEQTPVLSLSAGNWAVSAIEQYYLHRARELGFEADLKLIPPKDLDGFTPDLCLILSNLLENSIEALKREGGGWLRGRSMSSSGYFTLVLGNTCTRPLRTVGGRYLSSKAPGRLGIGLDTVRQVVRDYGGQAQFTVENGEFRARIFLPQPPRKKHSPQ